MSKDVDTKKKICALTTISKTMDWFIVDSMRNLANNGYEVTLICDMEEGFKERNSDYAKCIHIPMSRGASVKDLITVPFKLRKIFKKNQFDVIYYTSPNVSLYASIGGLLAGIKRRVYRGEKLYEEKLMAEEGLKRTENELIHIGMPIPFDVEEFLAQLDELAERAYANAGNIRELVEKVVVTYHPKE